MHRGYREYTKRRRRKYRKRRSHTILIAALILIFEIFSVVSLLFVKSQLDRLFVRTNLPEYSRYLLYTDAEDQYSRELLSFISGKNQLQGYLYGAENKKGVVILSHGMGSGAESYLAETLYFVDHGYQVFSYDNTGCHRSEGESCIGFPQSVLDLDAALTYLEGEARFDGLPRFLYGHSWGGYAVTAVLAFHHEITACVSVAGFDQPMSMLLEWGKAAQGTAAYVLYPYTYLYQLFLFGKNANLSAIDGINSTDTPVLLLHGSADSIVSATGAATIARQEEISNPNAYCVLYTDAKQNGHSDLFLSLEAQSYFHEVNDAYQMLREQYGGEVPKPVDQAFAGEVDSFRLSALDQDRMAAVLAFYEESTDHLHS